MTDEKLQAIRAEIVVYQTHNGAQGDHLVLHHIPALLAEVERLRAENAQQAEWIAALMDEQPRYATANARLTTENARMREIVAFVAGPPYCPPWPTDFAEVTAMSNAMQDKARALLAREGGQP